MGSIRTVTSLGYQLMRYRLTGENRPICLSLFITNRCNLRCSYCFVTNDDIAKELLLAEFSKDEIFHIVDEFHVMGTRLIYLLGGEPFFHKDIGEIIEYITRKGILLHVITNGVLLEKKLAEAQKAHAICVSLDGIGSVNDDIRGNGVFERAIAGLKKVKEKGVKCRIHAVITSKNIGDFQKMAELAKEIGVKLTVSPLNHLGGADPDCDELKVSDEEYWEFFTRYRELKQLGYPIGNTFTAIDTLINWPLGYHEMMSGATPLKPDYKKPVRCVNGDIYCGLSADGTMYHCIQLGCFKGPNIKKVGVRKAWDIIVNTRPDCISCASMNTVENSLALRMNPENLTTGFRYQLSRK